MKTEFPISSHDAEINATLALLAKAQPTDGLEQRIQLRLAEAGPVQRPWHAFFTSKPFGSSSAWRTPASRMPTTRVQAVAVSLVAAAAVIAGVLLFTSHRAPVAPPGIHAAPPGFGAAAAMRIAPQPVKPALRAHGRGTAVAGHGRAAIGNHHKPLPSGVAVPRTPPPQAAPAN